jgi:signal recognition particle subunit SRP68
VSVDTASAVLDQSAGTSTSSKDRANAYDEILIASQDAVDATRRAIEELEKEGVDEGDARMQDLRVTNLAVNYDLISWRVGRNRVLIGADDGLTFPPNPPQKPRRPRKDGKEWTEREEPTGRKLARLRERIALYDAILQSIESVTFICISVDTQGSFGPLQSSIVSIITGCIGAAVFNIIVGRAKAGNHREAIAKSQAEP